MQGDDKLDRQFRYWWIFARTYIAMCILVPLAFVIWSLCHAD